MKSFGGLRLPFWILKLKKAPDIPEQKMIS